MYGRYFYYYSLLSQFQLRIWSKLEEKKKNETQNIGRI